MLPAIAGKSKPRVQSPGSAASAASDSDSCSGSRILLEEAGGRAVSPSVSSRTGGSSRVFTDGLVHQYAPIQTADCLPALNHVADENGSGTPSPTPGNQAFQEQIVRPPSQPRGACHRKNRLNATTRTTPIVCRPTSLAQLEQTLSHWPWHVVPPVQGVPGQDCKKPSVPNIPSSATGVFVLSEVKWYKFTCKHVQEIAALYDSLPLVVILIDVPNTLGDADRMLEAQSEFRFAGADDVIIAIESSEPILKLTIAMAVQRASWRGEEHQVIHEAMQEQEKEEQAAERDKMFWSCVHRVFMGFPKIDPSTHNSICESENNLAVSRVGSTELGEKLGQGAFGTVHLGIDRETGQYEAVKVLKKSAVNEIPKVCNLWREITLLRKLKHPGIVRLQKVLHTRRYVTIHMEVAGRMTLYDYVAKNGGRLEMPKVWDLGTQIADAISHCHSMDIAHRDIKHENIAVATSSDGQVRSKLIDFGLAVEVGCYGTEQRCGTMPYCPPEMLRGVVNGVVHATAASARHQDPRCADVWALGIVNLELAGGLGLLSRLLDWPDIVEAAESRGLEVEKMLGNGSEGLSKALANFTVDPNREDHQHVKPSEVLRNHALTQLLIGQLQVDPNKRLKMQEVAREMVYHRSAHQQGVMPQQQQHQQHQQQERRPSTQRSVEERDQREQRVSTQRSLEERQPQQDRRVSTQRSLEEHRHLEDASSRKPKQHPAPPSTANSGGGGGAANSGPASPGSSSSNQKYSSNPGAPAFASTPVQPSTSRPATGTRPVPRKVLTKSEVIAVVKEGLRW